MARNYGDSTYGDSTYGVTNYLDGEATPAGLLTVGASANAVYNNDANIDTIAGSMSFSADAIRVQPGVILIEAALSDVVNAEAIYSQSAALTSLAAFDAQAFITAKGDGSLQGISGFIAASREKWEPLPKASEIWTEIA